ncbi:MAG: GNAT family N-acetyltransferase, partial [Clostridiales bacterium]|nr:GNAT family N-acetyltransferase [Clostridiales bacterium]
MGGCVLRLKQDQITIRSAVISDAPLLNRWWNDGQVMAHAGFPNGLGQSLEETEAVIRRYEGQLSGLCIIEIEGRPAGELSFQIADNQARPGWKICETGYQNKGYGRRIIRMTWDYLFNDQATNAAMRIHRLVWDTNLSNTRAQHVYEALGARRLGVRENCWTDQLGRPQSAVDYELSREAH